MIERFNYNRLKFILCKIARVSNYLFILDRSEASVALSKVWVRSIRVL